MRERRYRKSVPTLRSLALAAVGAVLAAGTQAQAPLRCDLKLTSTPGAASSGACLDLAALQAGGTPLVTAQNATRISVDGITLCKNAFTVSQPAGADIVFIYDNSGSMWSHYAKVDAATGDTSFYHAQGCSGGGFGGGPAGTPLTYTTLLGARTIQQLDSTVNCTGYAGDPFFARTRVIAQAIDFLSARSPNSTVGAVAFERDTAHARPPLPLSVAGNADLVKATLAMDSVPATNYEPPLVQATAWLKDSTLVKTAKRAIVFLSDGEPNDGSAFTRWLGNNTGIPIYTVALGDSGAPFTRMVDMAERTGGKFYRVPPTNIARMNEVMQEIIQAITVVDMPSAIEISNGAFAPPMVSRSVRMARNADSSISPVMDSILALKQGANPITVKITMSDNEIRSYAFAIQADGPLAAATGQNLACYAMPTLTLLNQAGKQDSAYPSGPAKYDVRLTRATSDLKQVVVGASSSDPARPGWGDEEKITLAQSSSSGGTTVNTFEDYPINGTAGRTPAKNNNTLEAAPGGEIVLTWKHPRDERETATFKMPGLNIPTTQGYIEVVRATDAPKGQPLPVPVTDPVVIRGGVSLIKNGDQAVMTDNGDLRNPHHLSDEVLDPNQVPTFVFKTASAYSYSLSIFDHLGQFLNSAEGEVDSLLWEQMRGTSDSLVSALSILPVSKSGQRFATGVYIMRATITTRESHRSDVGRPSYVTPKVMNIVDRFGYVR